MNEIKLEAQDLFKAFEHFAQIRSSNDTIEHLSQSPAHILVHNEILKYSKEELESCVHPRWKDSLLTDTLSKQNPFFFSALIKAGAFHDKLTEHSQWILSVESQPSGELCDLIYRIERSKLSNRHEKKEEKLTPYQFVGTMIGTYAYRLNTAEKIRVLDNYIAQFGKKHDNALIQIIADKYHTSTAEVIDYIIVKLQNQNVDFSKNSFLNKCLPPDNQSRSSMRFSWDLTKIKKLLEIGYRFDEKKYSCGGDNLFITLCKHGSEETLETILPLLKDLTPKTGTWEEQQQYIDNLVNTHPNTYKFIQMTYNKLLLESQLSNNNSEDKKKIKL